jgi:predicted RNase H-like HicB family nuclease
VGHSPEFNRERERSLSASAETGAHFKDRRAFDRRSSSMKTLKFTYWKDGNYYLGFWNDYPDYQTQGMSKDELVSNLKDLLTDVESGEVPYIRKVEELVVAE